MNFFRKKEKIHIKYIVQILFKEFKIFKIDIHYSMEYCRYKENFRMNPYLET